LDYAGGNYPRQEPHVLTFQRGDPVRLGGIGRLSLSLALGYRVGEAGVRRGAWQVSIVSYAFRLGVEGGSEIIAYHWHPQGRSQVTTPHLHLGAGAQVGKAELARAHLPTGPVAVQDFLRMLITDFGVRPLRRDWEDILETTKQGSQ
jgi:hypothetical protein